MNKNIFEYITDVPFIVWFTWINVKKDFYWFEWENWSNCVTFSSKNLWNSGKGSSLLAKRFIYQKISRKTSIWNIFLHFLSLWELVNNYKTPEQGFQDFWKKERVGGKNPLFNIWIEFRLKIVIKLIFKCKLNGGKVQFKFFWKICQLSHPKRPNLTISYTKNQGKNSIPTVNCLLIVIWTDIYVQQLYCSISLQIK